MKKAKEITELLMELMPLYHRKLSTLFHEVKDPRFHCTKNQNRAIMILKHHVRQTPSRLGECLDMKKGSLTSLVDSLEGMGLVRRAQDPSDRRKVWVSLTGEGESYVERRIRAFERSIFALFGSLPDGEVENFGECLRFVVGVMKRL